MTFYSESIYLDLKKNLHGMNYQQLAEETKDKQEGKYSKIEQQLQSDDLGSRAYLFFEEKEIVQEDIRNVAIYLRALIADERFERFPFTDVVTRINIILHKYMEQPSLLDNLVEYILSEVIGAVRAYLKFYIETYRKTLTLPSVHNEFNQVAMIVYILTKVRGVKNVRKYMGHDVADLEPLVFFLVSSEERVPWETKYFLLIWLSVVLLIPFDLKRFDFEIVRLYYLAHYSETGFELIELLVLDFLKRSLKGSARVGEAVSLCVSVLFRRPDMKAFEIFRELVFWGLDEIAAAKNRDQAFYKINLYQALRSTIKDTRREWSDAIYKEIFARLDEIRASAKSGGEPSNLKHEALRFAFGLVEKLLRPNTARPIYRTAKRQLLEQTCADGQEVPMLTNTTKDETEFTPHYANLDFKKTANPAELVEESENTEYLPLIEYVVDLVLEALKDSDSNIRYLAAKNLAAIALRLPESLSDELLNAALELLGENTENCFHGVCLCIGEFCRKGILGPHYLPRVVPILKSALLFEEYQANYSTGFIVRDAACYISWTFAKAFDVELMRPFIHDFAVPLLLCALFDKNGNCRRAAAASFQENVGRQGYFPHGIEIISEMDFFSVGFRNNSYLKIAPFVAQFNNYTVPFIEHLSTTKIFHIEKEMRNIACKALGQISLFDIEHVNAVVLPRLLQDARSKAIHKRHGAILATACILLAFSRNTKIMAEKEKANENIFKKSLNINERKLVKSGQYMKEFLTRFDELRGQEFVSTVPEAVVRAIVGLPQEIINLGFLKGKGGEITRIALMYLVFSLSLAKVPLAPETIDFYFFMIEECLRTTIDDIHDSAIEALREFAGTYLEQDPPRYEKYLDMFLHRAESEVIKDIKKAFCRALSCFGPKVAGRRQQKVFDLLIANSKINKAIPMNDPEIRKCCISSARELLLKVSRESADPSLFKRVFDMLAVAVNDYSIDKRGDIGLIIREEVIDALSALWPLLAALPADSPLKQIWLAEYLEKQIGITLTQVFEPNDRLRLKGGFVLQTLVKNHFDSLPDFPARQAITAVFNDKVLRERFQEHQDKYFENYDISLIDNKQFLAYTLNKDFVFFWNIPRCAFGHTSALIPVPSLNYYIMKGLALSVASANELLSSCAFENLKAGLTSDPAAPALTLDSLLRLIQNFKSKEKFFVACMKTVQLMIKNDLLDSAHCQPLLKSLAALIKDHCAKSTSIAKVSSAADGGCDASLLAPRTH